MNMNFDELQNDWNSPRNNLPIEQQRKLAEKFTRQMIRRRRFQGVSLINAFALLTIITVIACGNIVSGNTKATHEWGLFPLLMAPWGFAIYFLRRYFKSSTPVAGGELPMIDSLRAAQASNREAQSRLRIVGVLYVALIPVLALMMQQLHTVGKVSARELTSMAILFGATLLVCGAGIAARYFVRLLPQQRQFNALLEELTQEVC
ncbi:MAG: hypothetical protein ABJC04_05945 [Verrucomicrobiota bacterium]